MTDIKLISSNGEPKKSNDNVLRLELVRGLPCPHKVIMVREDLSEVICGDCGDRLDPIFVLRRYAKEETRLNNLIKDWKIEREELEKRKRTICQHCRRITHISGVG